MTQLDLPGVENIFELEIVPCTIGTSPREWDNLGTMVCLHRRYSLGDVQDLDRPVADLQMAGYGDTYKGKEIDWDDPLTVEWFLRHAGAVVLPIYLYDHGGLTIKTSPFSCGWDSGRLGFIYATREDILENFGAQRVSKRMRIGTTRVLRGEVEVYDQYLRGEVYGYILYMNGEEVERVGGFYGTDWVANGMVCNLPKEARHLVHTTEVTYE